jgi:hypothetical protein
MSGQLEKNYKISSPESGISIQFKKLHHKVLFFLLLCIGFICMLPVSATYDNNLSESSILPDKEFIDLVNNYVDTFYRFHPIRGPEAGVHTYDAAGLDNMSPESLEMEYESLLIFEQSLSDISRNNLSPYLQIDYDRISDHIAFRRDDLEETKTYTKNPYYYSDIIQVGLLFQILFDYQGTTRDTRLMTVFTQLDTIPPLMDNAIMYMQAVSPELLDYGISSLEDTQSFLDVDIREYFAGANLSDGTQADSLLDEKIRTANDAIGRLIAHLKELETAPGEKPTFALGEERLKKRFTLKEGLILPEENPFDQITVDLLAELSEKQAEFNAIAHEIDPDTDPRQVWEDIEAEHPAPGELVTTIQGQVDEIKKFLREKDVISIPNDEEIRVHASPPFMLYWMATAWSTGPFETKPAPPAVYYVSEPRGILFDDECNEFLKNFVTAEMWSTSSHEAYPGHFIQGYTLKQVKKNSVDTGNLSQVAISNIFAPFSYIEGWAVYCEQMVKDAGFTPSDGSIDYKKYQLGQLSDKIYRLAGAYATIQLHLNKMDSAEAEQFIMNNSYITPDYAKSLTLRAAYEPDYSLYSIGSMELLRLRDDYKAALEERGFPFSYREYNDKLLSLGQYPIPILREKIFADPRLAYSAPIEIPISG